MTEITITGNCTRTPELKVAATGTPWTSFGVAVTPRLRKNGEWINGTTVFYQASCWGDQAENVCSSCEKGTRVILCGRLEPREYEDKTGAKRVSLDVAVTEIGPALRYATAEIRSTERADAEIVATGTGDPWAEPSS